MAPEDITQKDIDDLHSQLLVGMKQLFDDHKDHLGYSHKKIRFD